MATDAAVAAGPVATVAFAAAAASCCRNCCRARASSQRHISSGTARQNTAYSTGMHCRFDFILHCEDAIERHIACRTAKQITTCTV